MSVLNCSKFELFCDNIVSGENCYVIDENGKKYIDFESGVWCTVLGHNHPKVMGALIEQFGKIGHAGYRYTHSIVDEA